MVTIQELLAFRDAMNVLHDKAKKAPVFKWAEQIKEELDPSGEKNLRGIYDIILAVEHIIQEHTVRPVPKGALPATGDYSDDTPTRILLKPILKEIYDSGHTFPNSTNPPQCMRFCNPLDGKWDLITTSWLGTSQVYFAI